MSFISEHRKWEQDRTQWNMGGSDCASFHPGYINGPTNQKAFIELRQQDPASPQLDLTAFHCTDS